MTAEAWTAPLPAMLRGRAQGAAADDQVPLAARLLIWAIVVEVFMETLEGPIRYGLHLVHIDPVIFLRDAFLVLSVAACVVARAGPPLAATVFSFLAAMHGAVSLVNTGSPIPAIYGLKIFLPLLAGYLVALTPHAGPARFYPRLVLGLWLASVVGATLDKFVLDYPWVGLNVDFGGVAVEIGRDWQSDLKRVGGLARSSITLALVLPLLSLPLAAGLRSRFLRGVVYAATCVVLYWTTQKGAIGGYVLMLMALAASRSASVMPLKVMFLVGIAAEILLPTVLIHYQMPRDQGVFSFESFIDRIEQMWPDAWRWILRFPPMLGVGLGGIGGSQRFFAQADFNAADNLFVFAYANFGPLSLVYLGWLSWVILRRRGPFGRADMVAMASMTFLALYGTVISLVEDQSAALWIGACTGWLSRRLPPAAPPPPPPSTSS